MKKFFNEFKSFIAKGNVLDMAVGVIIGSAFGKIVSSLVNDILMPIIGVIIGGVDFTALSININNAKICYGSFIQSIVDFLIIAFCIFIMIKAVTGFKKKFSSEKEKAEEVKKDETVVLLEEIRDSLKNKQ